MTLTKIAEFLRYYWDGLTGARRRRNEKAFAEAAQKFRREMKACFEKIETTDKTREPSGNGC